MAAAKRVLVVHSFGNGTPPFTTHSVAFETELTEKMGERVDLDEVSLDMARYADSDIQEALVEYMQKRHAKWEPDLVVPIGSPAGVFVAQYRDRLFPQIPVLYTGMDRRRLPPGTLENNAAFVGESFDLPGFVEDILHIAPATTNIAVVIGASQIEKYWAAAFQQEFAPFTNRVNFTWLNDLPFDQMLDRVSKLPPRSFIFLVLLLRDASGVSHNADEALKKIHAVANAPVNSIFQHQLGMGIVGGRLYQAELEGVKSAHIAIRVLHGESATNFSPEIVGPLAPRYDWRELQRWKISKAGLPAGSTFVFREPTVWERYRGWIISGVLVCVIEALLIFVLIANLIRRRRAEQSLAESEQRFRIAADAAPIVIWICGVDKACTFLNKRWLEFTGHTMEEQLGNAWVESVHPDDRQRCFKTYSDAFDARRDFSMEYRLRRHDGEYRWISDIGKPRFDATGNFAGYIGSCLDVTESRYKTEALVESENRLRSIFETAVDGIITINERGIIESVNPAAERIFGYGATEMIGHNVSVLVPAPLHEERDHNGNGFHWINSLELMNAAREVMGRRKNGSEFPMDLTISRVDLAGRRIFTSFVRDISERKQAERATREFGGRLMKAQEEERARLARELHDDITQRLARLAIDAGRAESEPANGNGGKPLRDVREGIARLSEDLHSLSYRLHPSMLTDLGLTAALRAECESFSEDSSISTEVDLLEIPERIPQDAALGLFRIAQEALHNVARHSGSKAVKVILRPLDGGLQLAVVDYGIGFDSGRRKQRQSLGLASMHERVRLLGGELDIESALGYGTTILAWVPLKGEI